MGQDPPVEKHWSKDPKNGKPHHFQGRMATYVAVNCQFLSHFKSFQNAKKIKKQISMSKISRNFLMYVPLEPAKS